MKKIPIQVSPAFLITAGIIGFINANTLYGILAWVGIIFISVLVHELGHALTSAFFGQSPRIELVAFGGLTIPEGPKLKPWKEFLVVLMGPLFGFALFVLASIILQYPFEGKFIRTTLQMFRNVNLFWTIINLLPILPLDGGQLLRIVLDKIGGQKMWRVSIFISVALASLASILFFLIGQIIIGGLFLLFVMQNFAMMKEMQNYSEADHDEENQKLLKTAEDLYRSGLTEEAVEKLNEIIHKTSKGIIHTVASEYLARIYFDDARYEKAFTLLNPLEKYLSREAKCILFLSAYEMKEYKRAISLAGVCFEEKPTADIAVRAALSHANLHHIQETIAWLKTLLKFDQNHVDEIVKDPIFDQIRNESSFQNFLKAIQK